MVYFRMYGNLGNLLFQYAAAMSLGRGEAIGVTDSASTIAVIRGSAPLFTGLRIAPEASASAEEVRQVKCNHMEFPDVTGRDVLLNGYFQSESYFDIDRVYGLVRPPADREGHLRGKYGDWLSRPGVTGISVRRGDYLKKAAWHPFVGERYFRDCLARLPEVRDFIVCSDGLDWCKGFFPRRFPDRNFLFVEGESVLDQLYVHALCANNVVSNSSFSWWGAWIGTQRRLRETGSRGVTLAPSMWLGRVPKREGATWEDIYFDGMEVVRNGYSFRLWLASHLSVFAEKP